MTKKVWLITGAARGLGLDIAKAALATGHAVVATGRNAARVEAAVGRHQIDVLVLVPLAALEDPLIRFAAAADAVQTFEANANALLVQAHLHRELYGSLAYDTP